MRRGGTRSGWSAAIKTWLRSRGTKIRSLGRTAASSPTAGSGDPARSLRLGALLYLYRGGPVDPLQFGGELDADELDALADLSDDDMHLANACLSVERQLLRRDFRRVERLLAADMFGEEEVDEALERGDVVKHADEFLALMALGLLN